MKIFACNKCGSIDLFIKSNGSHTGLYCGDCGSWQKWLNKNKKILVERQIENNKNN